MSMHNNTQILIPKWMSLGFVLTINYIEKIGFCHKGFRQKMNHALFQDISFH